jgi:RNase P/RNase MRP subunit p29
MTMHDQLPTIEGDVTGNVIPETPGVLKLLKNSRFSVITRDVRVADFTTLDGLYSQVHRQLRGSGFYVIGDHGIEGETDFHKSIEAAVMNALNHHYPPNAEDGAATERIDAAESAQDQRRR